MTTPWRIGRAAAAEYLTPGKDYVEKPAAASTTIPLEETFDPELSFPVPANVMSPWEVEGTESASLAATAGRSVANVGTKVRLDAAGANFIVEKDASADFSLTDFHQVFVRTCKDSPNGYHAFRVRRIVDVSFAAAAGSRSGGTVTTVWDSGNPIVNPQKVVPHDLGFHVAETPNADFNSIGRSPILDPATGLITGADMGGDHTATSSCRYALVEYLNAPVGHIKLTGAQISALAVAQENAWNPAGEAVNAGEFRDFHDIRDLSLNTGSGTGELNGLILRRYQRRVTGTTPAVAVNAVPESELLNWEFIGFGPNGVNNSNAAHAQMVLEHETNTGTPFVPVGDGHGMLETAFVSRSSGNNDRRPVKWRKGMSYCSQHAPGFINYAGQLPQNASNVNADSVYTAHWVDTLGVGTAIGNYWVGPRAVEIDPDIPDEFLNRVGVTSFDSPLEADERSQVYIESGGFHSNRSIANNGEAGAANTRFQVHVPSGETYAVEQHSLNVQRSVFRSVRVHSYQNMLSALAAEFSVVAAGDFISGNTLTLSSVGGTEFTSPIDHICVVGTAVQIPVNVGATNLAGVAEASGVADFFGGDWRFVIPGQPIQFRAVSTTGEESLPFTATIGLGAGSPLQGTSLDSATIAARNPSSILAPFTHPENQLWISDWADVSVDGGVYGLPGTETTITAATYDPATGFSAGQMCVFDPSTDTDPPVFTTGVSSGQGSTAGGTVTGHVVTDASLPITYTATVNGVAMPTGGWSVDPSTGDITYPVGLAPGTYNFVLTATDAASPANSVSSSGTLTIPGSAAPSIIYPIQFVPPSARTFENIGTLSSYALPGIPANEQIDYPNQDLEIFPDGSYSYVGATPLTLDVEVSDGDGTWDTVSVTVHPALDLATPNWTPPLSTPINSSLSIDAADVFNASLADPNAEVTFVGFPGASAATGNVLTVDTSAAGVHAVAIRATTNGHDYVTQYFTLTIVGIELVDFSASWAIQARALSEALFSWAIDSRTLVTFMPTWLLDGRETVTFTPSWALDSRELVETQFSWRLDARTLVESSASWRIDARALAELSTAWVVGQALTSAESTFSWRLDARATADFAPRWVLNSALTEVDTAYTWLITGTTLLLNTPAVWRVGVPPTEISFITDWLIRGPVELCTSASWRVLARSSFTQDRAFHILD